MATLRRRWRLPAVIIETKSRQASRDSWRANQTRGAGLDHGFFASQALIPGRREAQEDP